MNPISRKQSKALRYRKKVRDTVIQRDKGLCVRCGRVGHHVHEIIPRSRFGITKTRDCYQLKNMCVLCLACHERVHNPAGRRELLGVLGQRYGYDYSDEPWAAYTPCPSGDGRGIPAKAATSQTSK